MADVLIFLKMIMDLNPDSGASKSSHNQKDNKQDSSGLNLARAKVIVTYPTTAKNPPNTKEIKV